jgi:hypothetical protein
MLPRDCLTVDRHGADLAAARMARLGVDASGKGARCACEAQMSAGGPGREGRGGPKLGLPKLRGGLPMLPTAT